MNPPRHPMLPAFQPPREVWSSLFGSALRRASAAASAVVGTLRSFPSDPFAVWRWSPEGGRAPPGAVLCTAPETNGVRPGHLLGLYAANIAVFGLWKIPRLKNILTMHFTTSPMHMKSRLYHTLVTHMFSHASVVHLVGNLYTLDLFATFVLSPGKLTVPSFWGLYLAAGVAGGALSNFEHAMRGFLVPSLGASGGVFGLLTYALCCLPGDSVLRLFFVLPVTVDQALMGALAVNVFFTLTIRRLRVNGTAHLGGMAVGAGLYALQHRNQPPPRPSPRRTPPVATSV